MKLRMYGATDKGLVRALNQDAYSCSASQGLVVVSDGMGGHAAGEVASHMVVEGLTEDLAAAANSAIQDLPARIDEAIQKVNTKLLVRSQEDPGCRGMGATVNVLCFTHGFVTIGHVGDSRTYLIQSFRSPDEKPRYGIWQLTVDHNLGTFIDRGILNISEQSPELQISSRERSKLTRGMGVMPDPKPDIYTRRIEDGDVFLTCSDGLHGFVSDRDVLRTIISGPISEAPQRLIEIAKAAGAPDNVTVVLSVISDHEEPLREHLGTIFQTRPYLLRLPNGEIQGLLTCAQILEMWVKRILSSNTEMAAGLGPWVLLRNKDSVIQAYSEFKTDSFINHVNYDTSADISEPPPPATDTPAASGKTKKRWLGFVAFIPLFAFFVWFACQNWIYPELLNVLLPAY